MSEKLNAQEARLLSVLLAGDHPVLAALRRQAEALLVESREYTGVGFLVHLKVPPRVPRLRSATSFALADVKGRVSGVGARFVLFVEDGALDCLECHTSGDGEVSETWELEDVSYVGEDSSGSDPALRDLTVLEESGALPPSPVDPKWYETFFSGVVLELWGQAMSPEQTRAEADFVESALALSAAADVLDIACGLGRHALELAGRGHRVTGVDVSKEALATAESRAREARLELQWRHGDLCNLELEGAFDGAYLLGNVFGYADAAGMRAACSAIARVLRPGGRLLFDTGMVAECLLTHLRDREWNRIGDFLFLEENVYHAAESCLETRYTMVRDGTVTTRSGFHWVFTLREVHEILADGGFAVEHLYSSPAGESFQMGAPYLLVVARKA